MEKRYVRPKIIILLLGLLLIAGAAAAAMSIDGGKWLTVNPVFAQPPEGALEQNVVVPVTGSGPNFDSVEKPSVPSENGCNHDSAMNPADW